MAQEGLVRFSQLISLDRQLDLLNKGYKNILPDNGIVVVKPGKMYYVIIVDHTVTFRVRKSDLYVYDFYKKPRGTVEDMIKRYQEKILRYSQRANFAPKVEFFRPAPVVNRGYVGKIFGSQWGYDQTNNDFVQVVSETDKQVKVIKLQKIQTPNEFMSGSEKPVPNAFSQRFGKPFTLVKYTYRGQPALKGVDKSGTGSSQSAIWELWDGKEVGYSTYA